MGIGKHHFMVEFEEGCFADVKENTLFNLFSIHLD